MSTSQVKNSVDREEPEDSPNLLPYKNKVTALVKQLENLNQSFTTSQLKEYDEAELSVRLDYIEELHRNYEKVQCFLEENEGRDADGANRMMFVSLYLNAKAKLTRQMKTTRNLDSNPCSSTLRQFSLGETPFSQTSLRKTKVPEISLPKFCGAYAEWPTFYSLFSTVIHDNGELSNLEKFYYLRASLDEAALDTIASLELNEKNYEEALILLKNRFDNKLLNFQTHIKEMFALCCVENDSANGLRRLCDKFNAHLRAIQTIGNQKQIIDGLLIYLISSKLDTKSQMKWEENLSISELPTWDAMAVFLERRCRMVENFENSAVINRANVPKLSLQQNRHVHLSTTSSSICSFCDSKDHFITSCARFGNLSPSLRFKEAKRLKLCLNCLKKGHMLKTCTSGCCRRCSLKHHTMLHIENIPVDQPTISATDFETQNSSNAVLISSSSDDAIKTSAPTMSVLLATAIIMIKNQSGVFVPCRVILDSASQLNLITNRFVNHLRIKCNRTQVNISGIGDGCFSIDKSVDIVIKSKYTDYSTSLTAMVVPSITNYQPNIIANALEWNIPKNIQLADPSFDKCGHIDGLLGAELFFDLMSVGQVKLADNLPVLQKTLLGWVVSGGCFRSHHSWSLAVSSGSPKEEVQLSDIVKSFWEVENNFESCTTLSNEDILCENHFVQNTIRLPSGEFSVRLPQKEENSVLSLGESYSRALQRFKSLERKLNKFPEIKTQYAAFMSEYLSLNHMSLICPQIEQKMYFLPHHCVHKLDSTSTKLRVVFDGSAKTTSGLSLNDVLLAGPTIQPKLFNTILRYRFFKVALSGDICKMYRCVRVSYPDDYLQCILWRSIEGEEIKTYKLNTVTYGTKPAAFLAVRAMQQLAADEEHNFPLAAKIIRRDFYVDDMISGGDSVEKVKEIRQQVAALLQKGNFIIKKWCSNDSAVLDELPTEQRQQYLKFADGTDVTKTLGLVWEPKGDNFIFSFKPVENCKVVTKRTVLSSIARLYDPLGLIGPVITKAKIFMQQLWKLELQWDESLPQALHSSWLEYISKFDSVQLFTFPRYVSMPDSKIQIHGFCDASLAAYGACIYVRAEFNNTIKLSLLCSKSRVSPLKSLTVPKLELASACLLAELVDIVVKNLPCNCDVHCWSDSMVVLSWLREHPANFNIFVSNRVSRIQTLTSQMRWHYVPTNLNPADILSRGASPEELLHSTLWSAGPNFLYHESLKWPDNAEFLAELPERRRNVLVMTSLSDLSIQCKYHNSFPKMQRIFAYVFKFLYPNLSVSKDKLTPEDLKNGTLLLIKNIQLIHFVAEYKALKTNKGLSSSSKLLSLRPFIDSAGLIRVGGRLQNSTLCFDAQHPIVLPKTHPFTKSLVLYFHERLLHAGPQCLLASIRQQYWPIGGRKLISSIISKCLRCFKMKPRLSQHVMGDLPADRVRPNRAFYTTGVDFCGPFYYKSEVRSRPPVKCYIAIFICFSTKASHLEVAQDLSTPSFLCALRRFISTRGKPKTIWSDNATNFVGAKNELSDLKQLFLSQSHKELLHQQCLSDEIEWKFIPPRSPHFGGLWEAAVKSAKLHFYKTVGLNKLTFDELRTLVCEISAILNSRPLCPISEDPNDLEVLTPGHFLIGGPLTSIIEPNVIDLDINRLSSWQRVCQLQQIFWRKWSHSYLSLLQERMKWRDSTENIRRGAMVLLKDESQPPLKWQLGRVTDVVLGDDNVARVVIVRTVNGLIKRAVAKVAVLPVDSCVESPSLPTGGGC